VTGASRPAGAQPAVRILMVCMGNICRSPTAEGVLRQIAAREAPELALLIDSAGTHDYHIGHAPDPRAQAAALRRGIDLAGLRARRLLAGDFAAFDHILVMDQQNLHDARALAPPGSAGKARLLLDYAPAQPLREVPDPYYGGSADFEQVLDLSTLAARGLLATLRQR
jgi:protein-tyrosine phosphatase